ncbi:MAG: hypothetical protein Q9170_003876 [Blastenia crenularia]
MHLEAAYQQARMCNLHRRPSRFLVPALYSYSSKAAAPIIPIDSKHSTTSASLSRTKPSQTEPLEVLNPPATTLPPPLVLPTREPNITGTRKLTFYYRTGKAYLSFYKAGVKAIYQNYQILRKLRPRIPRGKSLEQALRDGALSRAEYQLIRRTRRDVSRIPLFGLVLAICGEFTPLVVVFMGLNGAVPTTCHIPRQIDGAREKLEARRQKSFREGTITNHEVENMDNVQRTPRPVLVHVGRSLGLYSSLWDRIGLTPTVLLPWRIRKALDRIDVDDFAIERDGGVERLSDEEVKLAAVERGLDVVGKPTGDIRSTVFEWMQARKRAPMINLLSSRPPSWPRE